MMIIFRLVTVRPGEARNRNACSRSCRPFAQNERNHHDDHLPLCHRASRRSSQPQCLFPQLQAVCSAGCIGHIFVGTVVQDR